MFCGGSLAEPPIKRSIHGMIPLSITTGPMTVQSTPSFEYWNSRRSQGDMTLWLHLRGMEAGIEGGFSQRMFAAMDKADSSNRERLYEAFPELFNPKGIGY